MTAITVVNQQIITGTWISSNHFHWYYNVLLSLIILTVLLFAVLEKLKLNRKVVYVLGLGMILFFFFVAFRMQTLNYAYGKPQMIEDQRYVPIVQWLNSNTEKDETIFSVNEIASLVVTYTSDNVYFGGTTAYNLVPDERLFHIFYVYTFLDGVSKENSREYFEAHREDISGFVFCQKYRMSKDLCYTCFPDSVIDKMVDEYSEFSEENFIEKLKKYPADYIVWDTKKNPEWQVSDRFGLKPVAQVDDFIIFRL